MEPIRRMRHGRAQEIRCRLKKHGIDPPSDGRIATMLALSEQANAIDVAASNEKMIRAEKDLHEIQFILGAFEAYPPSSSLLKKFREAVCNDPYEPAGTGNSPGRDAQFEVYVGAVLARAQLNPVHHEEHGLPDFDAKWLNRDYAVEAKRVKSTKRVLDNFAKACEQIDRRGVPGFVVMDLGPELHKGKDVSPHGGEYSKSDHDAITRLQEYFDRHKEDFVVARRGFAIRSAVAVDWIIRIDTEYGWVLDTFWFHVPLDPYGQRKRNEAELFFNQLQTGLPGKLSFADRQTAELNRAVKPGIDLSPWLPRL